MKKKWVATLTLLLILSVVGIGLVLNVKGERMSETVIPQEGIYEESNYGFWVPTTTIDVILKINSNIVFKAHDSRIFREHANTQGSGGIDSIIHKGVNLIEVYFKQYPASMFPEKMANFINTSDKNASAYIHRNDNVYKDGKPYTAKEFTEVHIKFELDEEGNPVITTPEGTLTEKDLKIEPYENGYTKVTANFILNDARQKAWEQGTPYNDRTNEHRQMLEHAYLDLWNTLNAQDWTKIKQIYGVALEEARAQEPMISEAMVYSMISPEETVKDHGLRLMSMYPFEKYEVETNNDGKLMRLVIDNDEGVRYSPIVFQNREGEEEGQVSITPWFSIIDGEVVLSLPF